MLTIILSNLEVDDVETGTVYAESGFWNRARFADNAPGVQNPWRYGEIMAPFDQEVTYTTIDHISFQKRTSDNLTLSSFTLS